MQQRDWSEKYTEIPIFQLPNLNESCFWWHISQSPETYNFKPKYLHFDFQNSKLFQTTNQPPVIKYQFKNIITFPKLCYKMLNWDILICQNTFSNFLLEMNYSKIDLISCSCFKRNAQTVYGSSEWFCLSLWVDLINITVLSLALLICSTVASKVAAFSSL